MRTRKTPLFASTHHAEIAGVLRDVLHNSDSFHTPTIIEEIADYFAVMLDDDNPAFDSDKFREGAGL